MSIVDGLSFFAGFVLGYIALFAIVMFIFLGVSAYNDRKNAETTGDSRNKRRYND